MPAVTTRCTDSRITITVVLALVVVLVGMVVHTYVLNQLSHTGDHWTTLGTCLGWFRVYKINFLPSRSQPPAHQPLQAPSSRRLGTFRTPVATRSAGRHARRLHR